MRKRGLLGHLSLWWNHHNLTMDIWKIYLSYAALFGLIFNILNKECKYCSFFSLHSMATNQQLDPLNLSLTNRCFLSSSSFAPIHAQLPTLLKTKVWQLEWIVISLFFIRCFLCVYHFYCYCLNEMILMKTTMNEQLFFGIKVKRPNMGILSNGGF